MKSIPNIQLRFMIKPEIKAEIFRTLKKLCSSGGCYTYSGDFHEARKAGRKLIKKLSNN